MKADMPVNKQTNYLSISERMYLSHSVNSYQSLFYLYRVYNTKNGNGKQFSNDIRIEVTTFEKDMNLSICVPFFIEPKIKLYRYI